MFLLSEKEIAQARDYFYCLILCYAPVPLSEWWRVCMVQYRHQGSFLCGHVGLRETDLRADLRWTVNTAGAVWVSKFSSPWITSSVLFQGHTCPPQPLDKRTEYHLLVLPS